jgi:hypothetical protein
MPNVAGVFSLGPVICFKNLLEVTSLGFNTSKLFDATHFAPLGESRASRLPPIPAAPYPKTPQPAKTPASNSRRFRRTPPTPHRFSRQGFCTCDTPIPPSPNLNPARKSAKFAINLQNSPRNPHLAHHQVPGVSRQMPRNRFPVLDHTAHAGTSPACSRHARAFPPTSRAHYTELGSGRHGPHCMALCGAGLSWLLTITNSALTFVSPLVNHPWNLLMAMGYVL